MEIALCTCEGRVKREHLEKIENAHIFDRLCHEKPEKKFDIAGCSHPALKDTARILIDLNNLIFLRQKEPAERTRVILKAYSEILKPEISFIDAEIDSSLLVITDSIEFVSLLAKHFEPLYVLTDDPSISEIAIAIKGKIKSISGSIGNFNVELDGTDLRTGKKIRNIEVSQIIIPGIDDTREGIFSSELQALEAVYNKEGIVKVKPVIYHDERCGVSFNGVHGCRLCRCPYGLIQHRDRVIIDLMSCPGCGLCSSLCPSDALSFQIFPRSALLKMIEVMSEYRKRKTLLYACKNAIGRVYGEERTDTFFPVILPCINSLSEVEVLYPLVRGFSGVYILPCECPHEDFEGAKKAVEIARAFEIESIVIERDFYPEIVRKLNRSSPVSDDFQLNSLEKRKQLAEIISEIKKHNEPVTEKLNLSDFGSLSISDSCTLCKTCSSVCPTNAIERNNGRLEFIHGLCINCNLCRIFCPEGSIKIESGLYLMEADIKKVLKEEKMIKCPRCKKEHISESEYRKISALTNHRILTLYCNECKPVIVFEGLYREIAGEENEQNK